MTAKLTEINENVRTIRVAIEGPALELDFVESHVADLGSSVHSIDEVSCGEQIIDDPYLTNP